jgi:hypothetical protein
MMGGEGSYYENVWREGTRRPSTEPMLMIREGFVSLAPASSMGVRSWVIVKTRVRFNVRTRVQALSGNCIYVSLFSMPSCADHV